MEICEDETLSVYVRLSRLREINEGDRCWHCRSLSQTIATIWLSTSYRMKSMSPCQSKTDLVVTTGRLTQEFSAISRINTVHEKQTCLTCKTYGEILYVKKDSGFFVRVRIKVSVKYIFFL